MISAAVPFVTSCKHEINCFVSGLIPRNVEIVFPYSWGLSPLWRLGMVFLRVDVTARENYLYYNYRARGGHSAALLIDLTLPRLTAVGRTQRDKRVGREGRMQRGSGIHRPGRCQRKRYLHLIHPMPRLTMPWSNHTRRGLAALPSAVRLATCGEELPLSIGLENRLVKARREKYARP
jgi:hypothetical protein